MFGDLVFNYKIFNGGIKVKVDDQNQKFYTNELSSRQSEPKVCDCKLYQKFYNVFLLLTILIITIISTLSNIF